MNGQEPDYAADLSPFYFCLLFPALASAEDDFPSSFVPLLWSCAGAQIACGGELAQWGGAGPRAANFVAVAFAAAPI